MKSYDNWASFQGRRQRQNKFCLTKTDASKVDWKRFHQATALNYTSNLDFRCCHKTIFVQYAINILSDFFTNTQLLVDQVSAIKITMLSHGT